MTAIVALALCAGSAARAENKPAGIKEAQAECRSALASDGLGHNSAWINTICSCPSVDRTITDYYVANHPRPLNEVKRLRQICDGAASGGTIAGQERPPVPGVSPTLAACQNKCAKEERKCREYQDEMGLTDDGGLFGQMERKGTGASLEQYKYGACMFAHKDCNVKCKLNEEE